MNYFAYIEHIPTQRKYTPVTEKTNEFFRGGRNWRRTKGTMFADAVEADWELNRILHAHREGENRIRIRDWEGRIRQRDFRVVEVEV